MQQLWTGLIDQLPKDEPPPRELFAEPTWRVERGQGVAVVEVIGLLDQAGWIATALRIEEASRAASSLVVRIDSRASEAQGVLVAAAALADASRKVPTAAHLHDCVGAAWLLAQSAQAVAVDDGGRHHVGPGHAEWLYDDGAQAPFPAEHVETLLAHADQRAGSPADQLARAVTAGRISLPEANRAMALMLKLDGSPVL